MNIRLSVRKETILRLIVDSFIQYPEPIGSRTLLRRSKIGVSPATIRNEMNELEHLDYITHPHTSAGRTPTDKGYRYYVDHLLSRKDADHAQVKQRIDVLKQEIKSIDSFFNTVSSLMSDFTSQVGVIVFPVLDDLNFRYANLIYLNEHKVLVVWTTMSGIIKEQIVFLEQNISQELLKRIANFMNEEFFGVPFHAIKDRMARCICELEESYHTLLEIAEEIIQESIVARQERKVWIDGVSNMFDEPDFQEVYALKPLLETLGKRDRCAEVFGHDRAIDGIITTIGKEHPDEEFKNCTIVRRNFYIADSLCGTLSVLGSRRMNYGKVFTTIDVISDIVSGIFREENNF